MALIFAINPSPGLLAPSLGLLTAAGGKPCCLFAMGLLPF
jgi:hypothetical protein